MMPIRSRETDMYYIGAYWGMRQELLGACAARFVRLLRALQTESRFFDAWYRLGKTRKQALKHQVTLDESTIASLMIERDAATAMQTTDPLGFTLGLWTGKEDSLSASMTVICGCFAPELNSNATVLDLPTHDDAQSDLLTTESLISLVQLFVEILEPQWVVVASRQFRSRSTQADRTRIIGRMTYVRQDLTEISDLPEGISITPLCEGSLIMVDAQLFTTDDPAIMQRLDADLASLRGRIATKPH